MRISGNADYMSNRGQLITDALRLAKILGIGQTANAEQVETAGNALNEMLSQWQHRRINVSMIKDITVFPRYGIGKYLIGNDGYDVTDFYYQTELDADHSSGTSNIDLVDYQGDDDSICREQRLSAAMSLYLNGVSCAGGKANLPLERKVSVYNVATESSVVITIYGYNANGEYKTETITLTTSDSYQATTNRFKTITSITCSAATAGNVKIGNYGISQGDFIGIQMDDGTLHWDIVSNEPAHLAGVIISLSLAYSGIPDDAAEGNIVYSYTSKSIRPIEILSARLKDNTGSVTSLTRMSSIEDYLLLAQPTNVGTPNSFFYDPGVDNGTLYVWPVPTNMKQVIQCQARMPIYDVDSSAQNCYFPKEWIKAIKLNLAVELCPYFSRDPSQYLYAEAQKALQEAKRFENRYGTLKFNPVIYG